MDSGNDEFESGNDAYYSDIVGSTEVLEYPCSICVARDNTESESVKHCRICAYNLCASCTIWHANFPTFAHHQVVDVSMTTAGHYSEKVTLPRQHCQEHTGRILDSFCPAHDQLLCDYCAGTHHKNCRSLQYVPKIAVGVKKSQELETVKRATKTLLTGLRKTKTSRMSSLEAIDMDEAIKQSIIQEELGKKLHQRICELVKAEFDKVVHEYQRKKDPIRKAMDKMEDQIEDFEARAKHLSDFQEENESELFVIMKKAKKQEEDVKQIMSQLSQARLTLPKYKLDANVEKALDGIETLGHFGQRVRMLQKRKDGVKTASDTEVCNITDACLLADGSVVVTDWNNKSLKHLHDNRISRFDLETEPACVCRTKRHTKVAVTLPETKMVQIVSIKKLMKKVGSFSVGDACRGICFSKDEYFVCCGSIRNQTNQCIRVFDKHGSSLRTIRLDLGFPRRITVSPDGKQLHVTDKAKGVITMDRDGSILAKYSDLDDACGICTITDGDLLVSGLASDNVIHLEIPDVKVDDVLLKRDGVAGPASLCFDEAYSKLIICTVNSDTISMVDLLVNP